MSFHSWMQGLRSTPTPCRGRRHHRQRGPLRVATHRPHLETLEDRLVLSFTWGGIYPLDEFYLMAPEIVFQQVDGLGITADFNADGQMDLYTANYAGTGETAEVSLFLGRGDGTYVLDARGGTSGDITEIGTGDINGDGRPDLASLYSDPYVAGVNNVWVSLNDGNWGWGPYLFLSDATVTEGNAGTTNATFTLSLAVAPHGDLTFHFATADGSATAGSDYQTTSGTLTIPAGQTTGTISVPVNGDSLPELNESFFVNLSSAATPDLIIGHGTGTIADDEPHIAITPSMSRSEGNTGQAPLAFAVTLSVPSDVPVTVNWATADMTATAGGDYQAASSMVTFAPGETSKTVSVLVNGDRVPEPNETFVVNLNSPTNAVVVTGQGVGTIVDDEPRISIGDVTRYEGKRHQTTQFTFTVTLSAAYDQAVTMSFGTADGTATTSDGDYVARSGTLTFAPGETSKTITIVIQGDSKREPNETFYLDLFGNSNNSLFTKRRGLGTILNDD